MRSEGLEKRLLEVDAGINLGLGVVLATLPGPLLRTLGMPSWKERFYPRVLGGVLTGVGVALLAERFSPSRRFRGLGLAGAVPINMLGSAALTELLMKEDIGAPLRGKVLLWLLNTTLVGLSAVEVLAAITEQDEDHHGSGTAESAQEDG